MKIIQPLVFEILPYIAGSTRWKISIDQSYLSKVQLQYPSFSITRAMSMSIFNMVWFYFREYCYPAISFFFGREPVVVKTKISKLLMVHIVFHRLCFLQANNICRVGL